jgi:molybdopterin-guanine dinucleotide biosynthesis protein B
MKFFQPDVILIEGYKLKSFPKLLLIRNESDLTLINTVSNIIAIIYWEEDMLKQITSPINVPCFHVDDENTITWTVENLQELVHKIDQKN